MRVIIFEIYYQSIFQKNIFNLEYYFNIYFICFDFNLDQKQKEIAHLLINIMKPQNQIMVAELAKMFRDSVIYKFFKFLKVQQQLKKTPFAKQTVTFTPHQNPNTFTLFLQRLHQGNVPEFAIHGYDLRRQLQMCGLNAVFGAGGKNIISHPALNLNSSQQNKIIIKNLNYGGLVKSQISTLCIKLVNARYNIYFALRTFDFTQLKPNPRVIDWDETGDSIQIKDIQELSKSCPKANWLFIYLRKKQQAQTYYHICHNNLSRSILRESTLNTSALKFQYQQAKQRSCKISDKTLNNSIQKFESKKIRQKKALLPQKELVETKASVVNQPIIRIDIIDQVQGNINCLKNLIRDIQNKWPLMSEDLLFSMSLSSQILMWDKTQGRTITFQQKK